MKRFLGCLAFAIGFLIPVLPLFAAQSPVEALEVGSDFPTFSGCTLGDRPLMLPRSSTNKPTVLVFSFSRLAGKDARLWNEHLATDFQDTVSAYGVVQLESVPKILRRVAISGIKSSMTASVQNRTIVLYRDERLWRQRLSVEDEKRSYVVLLDQYGRVSWMSSGAFSIGAFGMLKATLAVLLRSHP